jgi:photosystem II stability/assembly factor-like uncharacterized protein
MESLRRLLLAALAALVPAAARAAWAPADLPLKDVTLRAVAVSDGKHFAASGSKGTYAVTADGGCTWRLVAVPGGGDLDFRGLARLDDRTAVLMSAGPGEQGRAKLFRTADGGATWTSVYETGLKGAFFDAITFWDGRRGLVMGDPLGGAWFLLGTEDGGRTWTRVAADLPPTEAGEGAFAASNTALALGGGGRAWIVSGGAARGRVFRSADFGRRWHVAATPVAAGATSGLFGAFAVRPRRVVVVGGDYRDELRPGPNIALSDDAGATWTPAAQTGVPRLLEAVGRLDAKTLIAVGPRGTSVSHDDGRTWSQVDGEAYHAIACAKGTCVAAGAKGRVGIWAR